MKPIPRHIVPYLWWLPFLLIPLVYSAVVLCRSGWYEAGQALWNWFCFMLPFLLVFLIHEVLLVRGLLMRGKIAAYIIGLAVLLGVFGGVEYWRNGRTSNARPTPAEQHPQPVGQTPPPNREPLPRPIGEQGKNLMQAPPHHAAPPTERRTAVSDAHGSNPIVMDFTLVILIIGANLSAYMFARYEREKERNTALENQRLQQELQLLKAQITPHFFMNVLNNIHGMVEINPTAAQEMIIRLSQLMRYVLYDGTKERIALSQEVAFLRNYVSLMQQRYSAKRLAVECDLPEEGTEHLYISPLLFIVIIENAFKHGICPGRQSQFTFRLTIEQETQRVVLYSANTRSEQTADNATGGIGLTNIKKRLPILFGDNYTLHVDAREDVYIVELSIPYVYE